VVTSVAAQIWRNLEQLAASCDSPVPTGTVTTIFFSMKKHLPVDIFPQHFTGFYFLLALPMNRVPVPYRV
jgi:hypothetical protein